MRRTGQGGAILGFIIGVVILTFLLLGGVYLMNQQSDRTRPVPVEIPAPQQPTSLPGSDQPEPHSEPSAPNSELPSQGTVPREIPQTGPRETLGTGLVLALVGGVIVAYVRSRRQFDSL